MDKKSILNQIFFDKQRFEEGFKVGCLVALEVMESKE